MGKPSINYLFLPGIPRLPDDFEDEDGDLREAADIFKLSQLKTILDNLMNEEDFLNPSIGTFLNDEFGKTLKDKYFNKPETADVIFDVQG